MQVQCLAIKINSYKSLVLKEVVVAVKVVTASGCNNYTIARSCHLTLSPMFISNLSAIFIFAEANA